MTTQAKQYGADLHSTKAEIAEMKRLISRLEHEIDVIKAQVRKRGQLSVLNLWI